MKNVNITGSLARETDSFRGHKVPVINPDNLIVILVTELPQLFKDLVSSLGFEVSSWPEQLQISYRRGKRSLINIKFVSFDTKSGKYRLFGKIRSNSTGDSRNIDNPFYYSLAFTKDSQTKIVSLSECAREIQSILQDYDTTQALKEEIAKLCDVWIVIGDFPRNIDFNKSIEEQPFVQYPLPWWYVHKPITSTVIGIIHERLKQNIEKKLGPTVKEGKAIWVRDKIEVNGILQMTEPLSCAPEIEYGIEIGSPFWTDVVLWTNNEDMKILYRLRFKVSRKSYATFSTDIFTSDVRIIRHLKGTLKEWHYEPSFLEPRGEWAFYFDKDVSQLSINDIVEEITNAVYDVVTGKTVYYEAERQQ